MTAPDTSLILRTCDSDLTSHGGFQWPETGHIEAPDWDPTPNCGNGLHGCLWGEGDGNLLSWNPYARWLVVEVPTSTIVNLSGKVKFPAGTVVHCGDRLSATTYLLADPRAAGRTVHGSTATAGDRGTATTGNWGTVVIRRWDRSASRWRLVVGYIGENGLEANVAYRLDDAGQWHQRGRDQSDGLGRHRGAAPAPRLRIHARPVPR